MESKLFGILLFGIGLLIISIAFNVFYLIRYRRLVRTRAHQFAAIRITALDNERMRIAADLHDLIGASLTVFKHELKSIPVYTLKQISKRDSLVDSIYKIKKQVRNISYNMFPEVWIDFGLRLAIQEMIIRKAAAGKMKINFHYDLDYLSKEKSVQVFLVIKEILINAVKHSKAKNVHVSLEALKSKIVLHIKDDGVGFNKNILTRKPDSVGLHNVFSRIALIDGTVKLDTKPNGGVEYTIQFPMDLMKEN